MMAYNPSTSSLNFSSSISESSLYSSPCSSPTSPLYASKFSVPFLWEERPGITKPTPSSTSLKACTNPKNIFYGNSLEFPPLPPPPCLSQAFLSQPRSRSSKLLATHSLISRRPHEAKPSKEEQQEDPFFVALKACTKVDNKCSRDVSKASFDGLQVALSIFNPTKKGQKSMECKRGDSKKNYEDSDHHQIRREVSFNHHQTRRELSFNGEGNGRGKLVATSTHGALHELFSIEKRASRVETRRSNLHTLMLEKDEGKTNSMAKRAHHHMNAAGKASSNGFHIHVGVPNKGKQDDPLQGLHSKLSRREHLIGAEVGGHSKPKANGRELFADEHRKPKHNNNAKSYNGREINDALDRINSKAKHSPNVVEFNYCGGYLKKSDSGHHASKPNMLNDMLGCKPLNGAAIHPSLHFQNKLFS